MKVGFIGTGNMGRILIEAMVESNALPPSSVMITNRTISKAKAIREKYKEITVVKDSEEVANQCDLIFLCVKPLDMIECIKKIHPHLSNDNCVVSITSPITVEQLQSLLPCSVARIIPSITNRAKAGVSLLTFGANCEQHWQQELTEIFQQFSKPVHIGEEITRIASDIVSCGPAFFGYIMQKFVEAAVSKTAINEEVANVLMTEMMIGLGELLDKNCFNLQTMQEKVSVKGGITGEGIKVLEEELEDVFEKLIEATHLKFNEDVKEIKKQLIYNK